MPLKFLALKRNSSVLVINFQRKQIPEPQFFLFLFCCECNDRVAGNPVCDASNVFRPDRACNQLVGGELPWSSPYSSAGTCGTVSCNDLVINPLKTGNCNCTQPLEMVLEARRPTFSVITDELMEGLRLKLVSQLNLQNSQVLISTAAFSPAGRAEINIDFFSADGVSMLDRTSTSNITHSLTTNALVLPEVQPYLARVVVNGETFCELLLYFSLTHHRENLSLGATNFLHAEFVSCQDGFLERLHSGGKTHVLQLSRALH